MLDRKLQCKTTYQNHILFQSKQLLKQMTPEARQRLTDTIQARQVLLGEQVQNQAILDLLEKKNGKDKTDD